MPEDKFSILFSIPEPAKKPSPMIWTVGWAGPLPGNAWTADERLLDSCGHVFIGFVPMLWIYASEAETVAALTAARSARFEHGERG